MTVRSKFGSAWQTFRVLGWLDGCCFVFDWLLAAGTANRARIRKYYFTVQPVRQQSWLPIRRGKDMTVRRILESDSVISEFPRPAQVIHDRFTQGAICLAAFKENIFVGFLWFTLGPYTEDEVRCRYEPQPSGQAAWDFDVFVRPEYRSGVAFLALWDEANRVLAAQHVGWSMSRISAFNGQSLRSHESMGARRIGSAVFLSLGRWQLAAATVRPFLHASLRPGRFPVFSFPTDSLP